LSSGTRNVSRGKPLGSSARPNGLAISLTPIQEAPSA
jgi:hypothetical protein